MNTAAAAGGSGRAPCGRIALAIGEDQPGTSEHERVLTPSEASTRAPDAPTAAARDAQTPDSPWVLERYRLVRRLGAGACGNVWAARDERLQRDVAVKILDPARIVGGRFEREARAAARLSHPAIVTLYEAGVDERGAYLVCELVRGSTLERLIADGRLSDRKIIQIGIALCDALEHAHAAGVIHRDVKPSNVLVPSRPAVETPPAKLTDFGVAHVVGADALTRAGEVIGTDAYMAPEQACGQPPGPAADLYSLALVLYEALSGVNPRRGQDAFRGPLPSEAPLPSLRRQRRELPRQLTAALDRALSPRASERGSLAQLREALMDCQGQLSDRCGTVAPPWRLPALTAATRLWSAGTQSRARQSPGTPATAELGARAWGADGQPSDARTGAEDPPVARRAAPPAWVQRAVAALAGAGAAAWLDGRLGGAAPSGALALAAAVLLLLAPRLGWLALVVLLAGVAAVGGHAGDALLVALAGLAPALLIARRGALWPLGAVAVALGMVGLGGVWPALAGRARGVWARASLGAIGWAWLSFAAALSGAQVYVRDPPGVPPPAAFAGSPALAVHGAFAHLARPSALAGAVVWAVGSAVAPLVARPRSPALAVVAAVVWAAALAFGAIALSGPAEGPTAATAAIGALGATAAMLALGCPLGRRRRGSVEDAQAPTCVA
jgi:tRNA A-37 threonylcarbamoyl transferase component Bud32